jgi:hypothetical protein
VRAACSALTVLSVVFGLASCGHRAQVNGPPNPPSAADLEMERSAIEHELDDWHAAAAQADEARYFGHLDESAVFLGTDAAERWSKPEFAAYAHPFFARGRAWSFKPLHRHVMFGPTFGHVSDDRLSIAWFDEELDTPNLGAARGSGVIIKRDGGRWLIAHYNLALTIPNEQVDEVKKLLEAPPR